MFSPITRTKILGILAAVIAVLCLVYAAIQKLDVPEVPVVEVPVVEAPVAPTAPVVVETPVAPVVVPVSEEYLTPEIMIPASAEPITK